MPLSMLIYQRDPQRADPLISDFGFGQPTGIGWVPETGASCPTGCGSRATDVDRASTCRSTPSTRSSWPSARARSSGPSSSRPSPTPPSPTVDAVDATTGRATTPDGGIVLETPPQVRRRIDMDPGRPRVPGHRPPVGHDVLVRDRDRGFAGFGIPVAGKTGTAETGGPDLTPCSRPSPRPAARDRGRQHPDLHPPGTGGSSTARSSGG